MRFNGTYFQIAKIKYVNTMYLKEHDSSQSLINCCWNFADILYGHFILLKIYFDIILWILTFTTPLYCLWISLLVHMKEKQYIYIRGYKDVNSGTVQKSKNMPIMGQWINKVWDIQTMECYAVFTVNDLQLILII